MEPHHLAMLIAGLALLGGAWLPNALAGRPLSPPIVFVAFGWLVFNLPVPFEFPRPWAGDDARFTERVTELVLIVSLMSAGLKIDRPLLHRDWGLTARLLALTMPLTIAAIAFLGAWALGLAPAAALLLGAVLAPTDPVLASDVQVGGPGEDEKTAGEVRFALTSEAGLNDGLAFPFVYAAIAIAAGGEPTTWLGSWLAVDVLYRVAMGVVIGGVLGWGLAHLLFGIGEAKLANRADALIVLAMTLLVYSLAELAHGYGFLAVFVAGYAIRQYEQEHEYHSRLHEFSVQTEKVLLAGLLVLFGGLLASGILDLLTWRGVAVALAVVLVVRPAAGLAGMVAADVPRRERAAIAFFGIRGIGSFYYLAYALNREEFGTAMGIWAVVGLVVLISIVLHGVTVSPVMRRVGS
ncbi:MAG TPA: cation:proton antiporter [Gemmatimonadota bacterium]|nr:cation:proton antiporter [Gemmatimonadota bacterium]